MAHCIIALIFISIYLQRICLGSQAPETYPMCVAQKTLSSEVLTGRGTIKVLNDNSATRCAFYCEEWHYKFSGTKNNFCMCVNRLVLGFNKSTKCKTKCPGDEEETCGGEGSVSVRRAGYVITTIKTPKLSRFETSSEVNITRLPKANVIDESTENTSSELLPGVPTQASNTVVSANTDIKTCATKEAQMTAVYISLPVGIIVAESVVLIGFLLLRRCKRLKRKARVKRHEVSSFHFMLDQRGNKSADDDHYQTIGSEISQYLESTTPGITTVVNCDAEYLTPVGSNDAAGYITPISSNQTVEHYKFYVKKSK